MSENTTEEKAPRERKDGVGMAAEAAILAGQSNEEALATVRARFPEAKTTKASINWYRNKLRESHPEVKTSRELRAANKPPKAPKAPKAKKGEAAAEADPLA